MALPRVEPALPIVLVVDDESSVRDALSYTLRKEGYRVEVAATGAEAIQASRRYRPDAVVLDIMLPGLDGFQVCRTIRSESTVPILLLSARGEEIDRVVGLELGADDYLTKPFAMRELLARIRAMLRRVEMMKPGSLAPAMEPAAPELAMLAPDSPAAEMTSEAPVVLGALVIDRARRIATLGGAPLSLRPKEFDLLHFLARHPGVVHSRDVLLRRVWGYDFSFGTRTVDVHVRWLRQKSNAIPAVPRGWKPCAGLGTAWFPTLTTNRDGQSTLSLPDSGEQPVGALDRQSSGWSVLLPKTLGTRLALTYTGLTLLIMGALGWFLAATIQDFYLRQLEADLLQETLIAVNVVAPIVAGGSGSGTLDEAVDQVSRGLGARVTVVDAGGVVLADSVSDVTSMDNHGNRPEIQDALRLGAGTSMRGSTTIGAQYFYVARASESDDFVVRLGLPVDAVDALVRDIQRQIAAAALLTAILMSGAGWFVAGRIGGALTDIRRQATAIAAGNLHVSVDPAPTRELGDLGRSFNIMTARMRATVAELERARVRLEATLANLSDGVIITDDRGRVALANDSALAMLAVRGSVIGEPVVEVARDHELADMVNLALASDEGMQERLVRHGRSGRTLQAAARRLDMAGEHIGVVVLRDITELRQLEAVRRDFVANVSHELRTPLTSIRVLVETLESGALHDPTVSTDFLARIISEVDRLALLVDDLLDLARIESGRIRLAPERVSPAALIAHVVQRMAPQTERAGLIVDVAIAPDTPLVEADRERIDQVLLNLLHNAIKFTPVGGVIALSASAAADSVLFEVRDTGVGVSPEELPRVFERFYKADRARRSEGTGLGLAIAKHIVQAHEGRIWADPNPEGGTIFSFTLPISGPSGVGDLDEDDSDAKSPRGATSAYRSAGPGRPEARHRGH